MARIEVPTSGLWSTIAGLLNTMFIEIYALFKGANTLYINKDSDFPYVGTEIRPDPNTWLIIGSTFTSSATKFVPKTGVVLQYSGPFNDNPLAPGTPLPAVTFDTATTLFDDEGTPAFWKIQGLKFTAPLAKVFNLAGGVVVLDESVCDECAEIGDLDGNSFEMQRSTFQLVTGTKGLDFINPTFALIINNSQIFSNNANFTSIQMNTGANRAVFSLYDLDTFITDAPAATATAIDGDTDNQNIADGSLAKIRGCVLGRSGMVARGPNLLPTDIRYSYADNDNTDNSNPGATLCLMNNTIVTIIDDNDVPVLVAGNWLVPPTGPVPSHFEVTASGRIKHIARRPTTKPIIATLDIEPVSGTNKDLTIYIRVYDDSTSTFYDIVQREVRVDNGHTFPVTIFLPYRFEQNDYAELWVTSDDGTNILVAGAVFNV